MIPLNIMKYREFKLILYVKQFYFTNKTIFLS